MSGSAVIPIPKLPHDGAFGDLFAASQVQEKCLRTAPADWCSGPQPYR